jgi:hypothetical protein
MYMIAYTSLDETGGEDVRGLIRAHLDRDENAAEAPLGGSFGREIFRNTNLTEDQRCRFATASSLDTWTGDQLPPRGAGMPRSFKAEAMPARVVAPSCCSAWITGKISAARLRAMMAL